MLKEAGRLNHANRLLLVLLLAMAMLTVSAESRTLTNIMSLQGECSRFVALGVDLTSQCQGKLANNLYSDQRTVSALIQPPSRPPLVFTFSGLGPRQIKRSAEEVVQPVDLLFTGMKGESHTDRAVGSCFFNNPYNPPFMVHCRVETSDGVYEAVFESNDPTPQTMRPSR